MEQSDNVVSLIQKWIQWAVTERDQKKGINTMSENLKPEGLVSPKPVECKLPQSAQGEEGINGIGDIPPRGRFTEYVAPLRVTTRMRAQRERGESENAIAKDPPHDNPISQGPPVRLTRSTAAQKERREREKKQANDMSGNPKPEAGPDGFVLCESTQKAEERKESRDIAPKIPVPVKLPRRIEAQRKRRERERKEGKCKPKTPKPEVRPTECMLSQSMQKAQERTEAKDTSENPKPLLSERRQRADEKKESTNVPPELSISQGATPVTLIPCMILQREKERMEAEVTAESPNLELRHTRSMLSQSMQNVQERMAADGTSVNTEPELTPTKCIVSQSTQEAEERKESRDFPPKSPISQGAKPCPESQRERERKEAKDRSSENPKAQLFLSRQGADDREGSTNIPPGLSRRVEAQRKRRERERKEGKCMPKNPKPELRPTECMLSRSMQRTQDRTEAKETSENPKSLLSERRQESDERKESTNVPPELSISQGATPVRLAPCTGHQRERDRKEANEMSQNSMLELRPTSHVLSQSMKNVDERKEGKDTSANAEQELVSTKCMLTESTQKIEERKEEKGTSINTAPDLRPTKCMLSESTQKADERKESRDIPPQIPNSQGVAPHLDSQRESERKEAAETSSENPKPGCFLPEPKFVPTQSADRAEERKESSGAPPILPIPRGSIPMALTARMKSQRRRREREKWEAEHTIPLPPIQTQYFKAQQCLAPSVLSHRTAFQGLCRGGERNVPVNSTSEIPKPGHFIPRRTIYISTQSAHRAEERKQPTDIPPVLPIPVGFIPTALTARQKSQKERRERERNKAKVTASKPLTPRMISQRIRREREKGEAKNTIPLPPIQTQYFKAQQYLAPSVFSHRTAFRGHYREGVRNVAVNSTSENPKPGHFIPRRTIYISTQSAHRAEERKESKDTSPALPIPVGSIPTRLPACMKFQKERRERERKEVKVTASDPLTPAMISQEIRRESDKGEKNHTTPSHLKAQQKQQCSTPSIISGSTSIQELRREGESNVAVNTASLHQSKVACCASSLSSGIKCTDKENVTWSVQRDETPLSVYSAGKDSRQKLLVERKKAKVATSKPLTPAMISQRIQRVREKGEEKHTTSLLRVQTQYSKAQQEQQFSAPSIVCRSTAFEGLCREGERDLTVNSTPLHQSKVTSCASSSSSTIKCTDKAKLTWSVQRDETPLTVHSAGKDSKQKLPVKRKKMMAPITYSTSGEKERMEAKDTSGNPMPDLRPTKCMLSPSTQKTEERKEAKDMPENPVPESSPTKCMLSRDTQRAEERKEPRDVLPQIPSIQGDHPHLESQKEGESKKAKNTSYENPVPELRPTECLLSQSTQKEEERKEAKDIPENPVPESSPTKCMLSQDTPRAEERTEPRDLHLQIPIFQGDHPQLESQRGESKEAKSTSSENPTPELRPTTCMLLQSTQKAEERNEAKDMPENPVPESRPEKCLLSQNTQKAEERKEPRGVPPQIPIFQGVHPHLESQTEGESKEANCTSSENPNPELRPTECMLSQITEKAMERKEAEDLSEDPEPELSPTNCTLSQNPWDAVEGAAVPRDAPPQVPIFQGVRPLLESQKEGEGNEAKGMSSENPEPYYFLSLIPNFMSAQSAVESKESRGVLPIVPIPRRFVPLEVPTSMNSLRDQRETERNEAEVITSKPLTPWTIFQRIQSEREKEEEKHTTPIPPIQTQNFKAPQKQQFSLPSIITRRTAFRGFRRQKDGSSAVNSTWLFANKCTEN